MWRVTDRLNLRGEGGQLHVIIVMQDGADVDYVMADGKAVTRNPDGTFLIDETGEALFLEN
ncbi:MAG: hypothetical protein EOP17_03860 [Rhizobiaceae bacterium]|nr:MAG: hypothetical protein EOP17_03860 [Rhizobiaceae bacterium]